MTPLAYILRPKTLDEIVGQQHLVGKDGIIGRMVSRKNLTSMILYGNPGIGKTTLALAVVNELHYESDTFNASAENKEKLKQIIASGKKVIIIDEIHRMKKDIQDYLLPYVERGDIILIGITTINPYRAVNPAVRSRTSVYKLNPLTPEELKELVQRAIAYYKKTAPLFSLTPDAIAYLVTCAGGEGRAVINMVETIRLGTGNRTVMVEEAEKLILHPHLDYDKNGDGYYDTLSGLHKSIRGSDVNASLHYLAKLLSADDLLPLVRRLYCIAYEDISLANPGIGPRIHAACHAALDLGMPEARLPLASVVTEMALSPKSNSTVLAIDKALADIEAGKSGNLCEHLKNVGRKEGEYKYPHDYPGAWVDQQYLPDPIKDAVYYVPKNSGKFEEALKERYEAIEKAKQKNKTKSET